MIKIVTMTSIGFWEAALAKRLSMTLGSDNGWAEMPMDEVALLYDDADAVDMVVSDQIEARLGNLLAREEGR